MNVLINWQSGDDKRLIENVLLSTNSFHCLESCAWLIFVGKLCRTQLKLLTNNKTDDTTIHHVSPICLILQLKYVERFCIRVFFIPFVGSVVCLRKQLKGLLQIFVSNWKNTKAEHGKAKDGTNNDKCFTDAPSDNLSNNLHAWYARTLFPYCLQPK